MSFQLPEPRRIDPASVPALRWGVVGTGWIAGTFVDAVVRHTTQRIVAVTARDAERTAAFAALHGIDRVAESLEALVGDPEIDVVYVATPHPSHARIALAAIAAGKHVLVEKPFALDAAEAREIVAASRAAGVFAMEAMWTRYLPQSDILRRLLEEGALGDIHLVTADFGFVAPFDPENRMWDPALGGGALLDAGVYPISFASSVLGAPTRIVASGATTSTGVDARAALSLRNASGADALLATSMISPLPTTAVVVGSEGRVEIGRAFFAPSTITWTRGPMDAEETASWTDTAFATPHEGLSYQATALASFVAAGLTESPVHPLDETVSVIATIDEARAQIAAASPAETGSTTD